MDFLKANEPFAISALIIFTGYLLKRIKILSESDGETMARIALNITLPAVILLNVPNIDLNRSNIMLPFITIISSTLTVILGLWFFRKQKPLDRGLSLSASSGYNIGLFALPMVAGVYGASGVAKFALLDMGNVLAVFGTAYYMAYLYSPIRSKGGNNLRHVFGMMLRSIPILCYLGGLVMNLAGWRFDGFASEFLGVFAAMNRGIALLTLGVLARFSFSSDTWKAIIPPLVLRYLVGILASAMVLFLFQWPLDNRIAIAGMLVMPMGLTIIPYAVKWGYNRERAAAIINLGIPVSFVLFWIIWIVGRNLS